MSRQTLWQQRLARVLNAGYYTPATIAADLKLPIQALTDYLGDNQLLTERELERLRRRLPHFEMSPKERERLLKKARPLIDNMRPSRD